MGIRRFFVTLADLMGPSIGGCIPVFQADIIKYGHEPVKQGKWQTKVSYCMDLQAQLLTILVEELFKER